jgi:hypothetical protein
VRVNLYLARRQIRIDRALRPFANKAIDANHPLGTHRLGRLEGLAVRVRHDRG